MKDMTNTCDLIELNLKQGAYWRTPKLKASFTLSMDKRKRVREEVQELTMFDGHCYVDMKPSKFQSIKGHDCHAFMKILMLMELWVY